MAESNALEVWRWEYTDELGKRVKSSWHMSEADVQAYAHVYRDAVKLEDTREVRQPLGSTSAWLNSGRPS